MALTDNPLFLRTLAPQAGPDSHAEPRERLRSALFKLRERAEVLAGEIHRDLPDFTVHDLTHLDALWEMADLIAGPEYPLNPMEAFALGAVFLIHDLGLGLAAYPGGLAELKQGSGWQDALSTFLRKHLERIPTAEELASPSSEVERMAVQERLRVLHAEQAERLAMVSWRHKEGPEYHLIEDPDLRHAIGPLLGKIAHSHWWPVSRLGSEFGTIRGALSVCPRTWTLDPLKVAILLRAADAAHLDARRAPGFLIALRRPEGISEDHWRFQNHLLKPRVEEDRLVYTTATPFPPGEVDAWWLCEETLRMVDREFHQIDALLADRGGLPRLRVRGVAGVESPHRLQKYLEVSGWNPVDARLHVSNVADLARKLGGEQLYGNDPTVPLRELIQNGSDAVRARRLLEDRPSNWGLLTVRLGRDEQGTWIEVEDTGIGMSDDVLTGPLLDFGTTYWGSSLMREEHEGLWAKGFEPVGRFGIGFFSIFIWSYRARVTTRRYDDSPRDTRILEFWADLNARPLIRPAKPEEQLQEGGTRVRVWHGLEDLREENIKAICLRLAPALDVDLYVIRSGAVSRLIAASDWLTLEGHAFMERIKGEKLSSFESGFIPFFQTIEDSAGRVIGRAALVLSHVGKFNLVVVGGLRAGSFDLEDVIGILVGSAANAVRTSALPLMSAQALADWCSSQAEFVASKISDPATLMSYGRIIVHHGGNPGRLPIVKRRGEYWDRAALENWKDAPDIIFLVGDRDLALRLEGSKKGAVLRFAKGEVLIFPYESDGSGPAMKLIKEVMAKIWECPIEKVVAEFGYHWPSEREGFHVCVLHKGNYSSRIHLF
jgi:hypothetical protein